MTTEERCAEIEETLRVFGAGGELHLANLGYYARADLPWAIAQIRELTAALVAVEWDGYSCSAPRCGGRGCPRCVRCHIHGHARDCLVGRALAGGAVMTDAAGRA